MTITLNISPEAEAELQRRALAEGRPFPTLVAEIVETSALGGSLPLTALPLPQTPQAHMSIDEWRKSLEAIAASAPPSPVLSQEATRRASIYEE